MKLFPLLLFIILIPNISSQITGNSLTEDIELKINVKDFFYFDLISPKNGTYISNRLNLKYIEKNTDEILLNINENENNSIKQKKRIIFPNGNNTLNIYIKKNNKTIKITKYININPNLYTIFSNNYSNGTETTSFHNIPTEKYDNIQNLTLQNTFGKIVFLGNTDIKKHLNAKNNTLNFDKNSYINQGKIYINQENIEIFNKKSIIEFYNIEYEEPQILKDKSPCEENCKIISYQNKILKFEVNNFSTYSIIESADKNDNNKNNLFPSIINIQNNLFEINETEINTKIQEEKHQDRYIKIKNNINNELNIDTEITNINHLIEIDEKITLRPNEEKIIKIRLLAPTNTTPKHYIGKIEFRSSNAKKEILVLIDYQSKDSLFDTQITILNNEKIFAQTELIVHSEILNLGETKRVDAELIYEITDTNENNILSKTKTLAINTRIETIENFIIPEIISPGTYILSLTVKYDDKIATSSESFIVHKKTNYILIFIIILISIILFLIIKELKKRKTHKSKKSKSRGK